MSHPGLHHTSRPEHIVGNRVASGSDQNPVSGPTAKATTAGAEGDSPTTSTGSKDPTSTGTDGGVDGGLNGK